MSSLYTQFGDDKIQNHVFYPTPLTALEMSDKEGVAIDTAFCLPSICVPNLEKSKNIIFSPWGHENIYNVMVQPIQTTERLKCLFQPK